MIEALLTFLMFAQPQGAKVAHAPLPMGQIDEMFVVAPEADPPVYDAEAAAAAQAAFDALVAAHTGGAREYRLMRCEELAYESRPVE